MSSDNRFVAMDDYDSFTCGRLRLDAYGLDDESGVIFLDAKFNGVEIFSLTLDDLRALRATVDKAIERYCTPADCTA